MSGCGVAISGCGCSWGVCLCIPVSRSANVRFKRLFIGVWYVGVGGGCSGLVGVRRLTITEVFSFELVA